MTATKLKGKQGFTLVEILIVTAILGLILGAVYSVYLTHQKSAYTQEEVVEVQQNLRIAMDSITKDIRMAGMLVPTSSNPVAAATLNGISLNTGSARGVYARISAEPNMAAVVDTNTVTCTVESPEAVDIFNANAGIPMRIIRPVDCSQPFTSAVTFSTTATDRAASTLTLQRSGGTFAAVDKIKKGDMIAMTGTAPDPNTVKYGVVDAGTAVNSVTCPQNQKCMVRTANCTDIDSVCYTNGTSNIIASNISGLTFNYILDDNTEESAPADLSKIRAVRVTITGQTSSTSLLSGGAKTRQLTSIVKIRNRR